MFGLKRKPRLLLLDDDPSMQRLMAAILRRAGYRIDVVSEAAQAIENIGRNQYQALLLDVMTPTEGGLTVIRHLREVKPALMKRVVLVTASPDAVLKGVSADVFGIVRKPFKAEELTSTIRQAVGQ
jgi:CheY-like chemotaxis protein